MLLTLEEIREQLNNKFSPLGSDFDDLRLLKRDQPLLNLKSSEELLNITFPEKFSSFLDSYNLDNFSLCNISFGNGSDYLNMLVSINDRDNVNKWWTGKNRPAEFIVIAISDPYTIILNVNTGEVFSMTNESSMDDFEQIASDFILFFRGLGTLFINKESPMAIAKLVSSQAIKFWDELSN
ncbi:nuclease [Providencia stuartii]|uniref:nuclease n=1 Tax=Providencia stuartii TaxID=588 RepID=UPI003D7FF24D